MSESFEDALRLQFRNLVERKEEIVAAAAPFRLAYEEKRREIMQMEQEELRPLELAMNEAEAGLFELSNDIAAIARALKGRTG